jgi:hypothetical protein
MPRPPSVAEKRVADDANPAEARGFSRCKLGTGKTCEDGDQRFEGRLFEGDSRS